MLIPLAAFVLQWIFWAAIQPYVWFLFYPAIFFSSWIGGMRGGLVATGLSAGLVWYCFIPPQFSFAVERPMSFVSIAMFAGMGILFSIFHGRLRKANQQTAEALAAVQSAKDGLEAHVLLRTADFQRANVALRESETKLQTALSSMTDAIFISDAEGRFIEFNEAFATFHKFRNKEECAKTLAEYPAFLEVFLPNGDLAPLEQWAVPRALRGERVTNAEYTLRRKDTGETWIGSYSFAPIRDRDGTIVGSVVTGRDITERKRAESAQAESEAQFRATFEQAAVGMAQVGLDGRWLRVNQRLCDIVGYAREELLPKTFQDITHPDDLDADLALVREVLAGELQTYSMEKRYIRKDHSIVPINLTVSLVRKASGEPKCFISVIEDITERKQAGEALRESEERFRTLVETAPEAIFIRTGNQFAYLNATALRLFGAASSAELLGQPVLDRFHPDCRKEVLERMRQLDGASEQTSTVDRVLLKLDGSPVQAIISAVAFKFEQRDAALVFARDITERKRMEEALHASEEQFHTMANSMSQLAWIARADGYIYWYNQRWYDYTGTTPGQMEGWGWQSVHDSKMLPKVMEKWKGAIAAGLPFDMEFPLRRADGQFHTFLTRGQPLKDSAGKVIQWFGTNTDVETLKQAEEEIRELNRTLEQRVQERTAELLAANQELSAFAYAVSHDLRQPLRAMNGFSQALVEDFGATLPGAAHEFLNHIIQASRRMGELIDGLLRLSRTTRGELRRGAVDLSALAARLLGELAAAEPERRVTWTVAPGLTAQGDERMIEAVLTNLLGNAWKYTAKTPQPKIEVGEMGKSEDAGAAPSQPSNGFFVRDNGAGFDMKHAAKLFQPFQRLHREDEFPGIGIGLATVQRIVHRHGGTIRATATPMQGATFVFSLRSSGGNEEEES